MEKKTITMTSKQTVDLYCSCDSSGSEYCGSSPKLGEANSLREAVKIAMEDCPFGEGAGLWSFKVDDRLITIEPLANQYDLSRGNWTLAEWLDNGDYVVIPD